MADDSTPHEPARYVYGAGAPDPVADLRRDLVALSIELDAARITLARLAGRLDALLADLDA